MIKIINSGCLGKMGHVLDHAVNGEPDRYQVVAGFDLFSPAAAVPYPVYQNPENCQTDADVIIDFSSPEALNGLLAYAIRHRIPVVLATTGYTDAQAADIAKAAESIPVFKSANMSLGINVVLDLVRRAAAALGSDYDIEIIEQHHNQKKDAPSGTALMIADAAAGARGIDRSQYVYDRHGRTASREKSEIGISSVRGGTIVGIHSVLLAGPQETIEIKHTAMSREIFANGALRAAEFIVKQQPGFYDMSSLISVSPGR